MDFKYYVFYKPYNVLTQFTKERENHQTLSDFLNIEKDVYPVGRLDKDSEGLLVLTNDKSLNDQLLNPSKKHKKTYIVQVENDIDEKAITLLCKGVDIKLEKGTYRTLPCTLKKLPKPPTLPERIPPVRYRASIPDSWVLIEITEGKNRQIRKMFASVGYPVLRLVRVQIEGLKIGKLVPGKFISMTQQDLYPLLKIDPNLKISSTKIKQEIKSEKFKPKTNKANKSFKDFRNSGKRKSR
ncbi:MAG: pseudouridine synthase [Saprospiraceae bacterium]|jgi:23S rRNA pseudouridine2457 synthase|nr:pseudouridine synthase [Saprospiraceae bacterium]